eukprot:SAG31_NODE_4848_length_2906_cov_3.759173_2_plen_458_part_00
MPIATAMPLVAGVAAASFAHKNFGHRRMAFLFSTAYPLTVYGLSAAAISENNLPAFAISYGLLGGLSFYTGYPQLPPFLAKTWFHNRQGFVLSVYNVAFGSGLILSGYAAPFALDHFRTPPVRVGGLDDVSISIGSNGEQLAVVDGAPCEVIVATTKELMASGFGGTLEEGVFVLGTGSNGVCEAMLSLGAGVFVLTQFAAWTYRLPAGDMWVDPKPLKADANTSATDDVGEAKTEQPAVKHLTLTEASRTPNFSLLFIGSLGVCMTGLPFLQLGKFMVNDMFGSSLGAETAIIAASFPTMLAAANMSGRAFWGTISDHTGRRNTMMMFGASVPALMLAPVATGLVRNDPDIAVLLFRTSAACSVFVFAGMPVMLTPAAGDIFGLTHSGNIYQRLWLSVPLANFVGTSLLASWREHEYKSSAVQLASGIDESAFHDAFGAPKADLAALLVSRALKPH